MAERIVAFLPGWIGDAVMATPALRSLRERFATARILWVAKSGVAAALQGSPWNDGIITSGPARGLARLAEPLALARMVRTQLGGAPDLAVLLSNSMRTGLAAWLSGANRRVGQALHSRRLLLSHPIEPKRDDSGKLFPTPIIEVYNQIARESGCAEPGLAMELFTTRNDESDAVSALSVAGFRPGIRIVGLHAGAAFGAAKLWPIDRFAEVARKLASMGFGVIVLGGPLEAAQARNLVTQAAHPMVRALAEPGMPPLSLGLVKAVIRRLALLLTTDSGPRHMASAFNRPVVTLFGPTHIAWTETWQENAIHLASPVSCGPCQMRICPMGHHECMNNIGTGLVLDVIRQVMEGITPLPARPGVTGVRAFDPPRIALGMKALAERKSA